MPSCAAFGCNNRSSKPHRSTKQHRKETAPKMTFHKFPKNPERRNAWAKALRRADWLPNQNSVLCSTHFTEDSFDRTSLSCVRIRDTAVPSIFTTSPLHFQDIEKTRESTPESATSEITPLQDVNTLDVVPSPSSTLPVSSTTLPAPTTTKSTSFSSLNQRSMSPIKIVLRQQLKQMKLHYQKKIKCLQQSERRHVRRIQSLKNLLTTLRKQKCTQL